MYLNVYFCACICVFVFVYLHLCICIFAYLWQQCREHRAWRAPEKRERVNAQSSKDFEKAALEPFGPIRGLGRLESGTLQSVLANAYECRAEITCYKTWDLGGGGVSRGCNWVICVLYSSGIWMRFQYCICTTRSMQVWEEHRGCVWGGDVAKKAMHIILVCVFHISLRCCMFSLICICIELLFVFVYVLCIVVGPIWPTLFHALLHLWFISWKQREEPLIL